jgi:ubiquinone/menaquinone biosynthesis C-methylase UbiE
MSRRLRLQELLAGVEGVALFRTLFSGTDEAAARRIEELRRIVAEDGGEPMAISTLEVAEGYARWSSTYDAPGNPLISAEQPVVWELLDEVARGRALDAACGTGRHARHLAEQGHAVTCVDRTPAMLALARERVPEAQFHEGDLCNLPLADSSFDVVVCALALEHVQELTGAIAELARVTRPGGRVILSESHPALRALGGAPFFRDAAGDAGVVRSYLHLHADYLHAFAAAGLELHQCREITFGPEQVAMQEPAASLLPEATAAAFAGFPAVLVWDLVASE